jgi:hypothetical protein
MDGTGDKNIFGAKIRNRGGVVDQFGLHPEEAQRFAMKWIFLAGVDSGEAGLTFLEKSPARNGLHEPVEIVEVAVEDEAPQGAVDAGHPGEKPLAHDKAFLDGAVGSVREGGDDPLRRVEVRALVTGGAERETVEVVGDFGRDRLGLGRGRSGEAEEGEAPAGGAEAAGLEGQSLAPG